LYGFGFRPVYIIINKRVGEMKKFLKNREKKNKSKKKKGV
jgi:hypothetical protein